ncbi:hypothetical protein [Rosistilla oblonga]|uniref:hypothetical protein n=1 Tax=Rosistilla oblonga TaxID=2527990 RepID=UPI003A978D04
MQTLTQEQIDAMKMPDLVKSLAQDFDPATKSMIRAKIDESDKATEPHGAVVTRCLHKSLSTFADHFKTEAEKVDGDLAKSLGAEVESIRDRQLSLEGIFAEAYPDLRPLSIEGGDDVESVEDLVKSMIATDPTQRHRMLGVNARIKSVMNRAKLSDGEFSALETATKQLDSMADLAKSQTPAKPTGIEERVEKLSKSFDLIMDKLSKLS